ncbi:hypothetical protein [Actinoplanes sp. CA-252034]|uniref:hypothetical protein n=1 Tax=Actinoplanes sp. CA-252034 TaxID=3239906 RepID=UPI003D96A0E1
MTVTGIAGSPIDLTTSWYAYPGGPAVDPAHTTIRITRAGTGAEVLPPTIVQEPSAGITFYRWIPPGRVGATYLATWTALIDGVPAVATETVEVRSAQPAGAHASVDDLPAPVPADAVDRLVRASRDVDAALLSAFYDPTAPDTLEVLRQATVAQVLGELADARSRGGFTIGKISVQAGPDRDRPARVGPLWQQAWTILQLAGLTGHGPQTR